MDATEKSREHNMQEILHRKAFPGSSRCRTVENAHRQSAAPADDRYRRNLVDKNFSPALDKCVHTSIIVYIHT